MYKGTNATSSSLSCLGVLQVKRGFPCAIRRKSPLHFAFQAFPFTSSSCLSAAFPLKVAPSKYVSAVTHPKDESATWSDRDGEEAALLTFAIPSLGQKG